MLETIIVLKKLYELKQNERGTRAELEEKKLTKFRRMMGQLAKTSPYYSQYIRENKINVSSCVPADFPIMDKSYVMDNFDEIITDRKISIEGVKNFLQKSTDTNEMYLGKYHAVYTSGSTGEPSYFVYHRNDWLRGAAQNVRFKSLRKIFSARRYAYYGSSSGHTMGLTAVKAGYRCQSRNNKILALDLNHDIYEGIDAINSFQPTSLGSYTTALLKLADEKLKGRLKISPQWIESLAEGVSQSDREFIEGAFGCGLYNLYGCSEMQLMGVGHPGSDEMILYDDDIIYEFYDDYILATNLLNTTLPLIRYKISDTVKLLEADANFPYLRVDQFIGRSVSSAIFINADGHEDYICSMMLMDELPNVARFQMVPTSLTSFNFHVYLRNGNDTSSVLSDTETWLRDLLEKKNMKNVSFNILIERSLRIDKATRKFKSIVQDAARNTLGLS